MSDIPGEGPGFSVGAFLQGAVEEGWSARRAIAEFRSAGMSMGNEAFRSMYASARETLAGRDALAGLDYNAPIPTDVMVPWAAGEEGNFASFVTSYVRMPGTTDIEERFFTHVTDTPHTPQEAIDAAAAYLTGDALPTNGTPQGVYVGGVLTSTTYTTGGF